MFGRFKKDGCKKTAPKGMANQDPPVRQKHVQCRRDQEHKKSGEEEPGEKAGDHSNLQTWKIFAKIPQQGKDPRGSEREDHEGKQQCDGKKRKQYREDQRSLRLNFKDVMDGRFKGDVELIGEEAIDDKRQDANFSMKDDRFQFFCDLMGDPREEAGHLRHKKIVEITALTEKVSKDRDEEDKEGDEGQHKKT